MMSDTQYEWLKENLNEGVVSSLRMDIRTHIHMLNEHDSTERWKAGEIHGYLRGLAQCGVLDFYTLLQFKDKMFAEELYKITKEAENARNQE